MAFLDDLAFRLRTLFDRRHRESDLDDELRFHLEMEIDRRVADGESRAEATRAARLEFGAPEAIKEAVRDAWGVRLLDETWRDLRTGARHWIGAPGFSLVTIGSLAVGLAAATVIFSLVEAVMLRPLPFSEPERIVSFLEVTPQGDPFSTSDLNLRDFRAGSQTLEHIAAIPFPAPRPSLGQGNERIRLQAMEVSPSLFEVLGVDARLGRVFTPEEEDEPPRAVVISDGAWRRYFGADPAVVGAEIDLDGEMHTLLGVLPEEFEFVSDPEIFLPYALDEEFERGDRRLIAFARLAPGATLDQAREELAALAERSSREYPEANDGWSVLLEPIAEAWLGDTVRQTNLMLLGAVALLLIITTANVAHHFLARASDRADEIRLRNALGAGRGRIVRQLMAEAALLGAVGTAVGWALAFWAVPLVRGLEMPLPRMGAMEPDAGVFAFLAAVASVSILLSTFFPALRASRAGGSSSLRTRRQGSDTDGRRLRSTLVSAEVAIATLLAVGAGLLLHSYEGLRQIDSGFDQDGVLLAAIDLPVERYPMHEDEPRQLYRRLVELASALPGVEVASVTTASPYRGPNTQNKVAIVTETDPRAFFPVHWRAVTADHFRTFGVPLVAGRTLDPHSEGRREAVISASLAARLWPGKDPIGEQMRWIHPNGNTFEIVGVAGNVQDLELGTEKYDFVYISQTMMAWSHATLAVRSDLPLEALSDPLLAKIRELDPLLAPPPLTTLAGQRREALGQPLLGLRLLGFSALIALALAAVGVYGMMAYAVSRRRREMGVRTALGARPGQLVGLVLGDGARWVGGGILAGLLGSLALAGTLRALLYQTSPFDPAILGAVGVILLAAGLAASALPALSAARIDPIRVLRED